MFFSVIKKFWEKQELIFKMCINQLPLEMKKRYEELVIFREDVNITPQVKQTFASFKCFYRVKTYEFVHYCSILY